MTVIYQNRPAITKPLIGLLGVMVFSLFSLELSAHAADGEQHPDGWESPAKLKPYVKLPSDASGTSSASATSGSPGSGTTSGAVGGSIERKVLDPTTPTDPTSKEIDSAVKSIIQDSGPDVLRLRKDRKAAKRLAKYHWLDKAADANPRIIEAITMHSSATKILAKHPRLSYIAEADHYTCRRITKYKSAARVLAANGEVKEVAALDPEGLYVAIKRDRKIVRILSRNPIFDQMIVENPDLARVISKYM